MFRRNGNFRPAVIKELYIRTMFSIFVLKLLFFARYVNYLLGKKIRRKSYPAESYFIQRDPFFDFHTQLPAKPVEIFER